MLDVASSADPLSVLEMVSRSTMVAKGVLVLLLVSLSVLLEPYASLAPPSLLDFLVV